MNNLEVLHTEQGNVYPSINVQLAIRMIERTSKKATSRMCVVTGQPGTGKTSAAHYAEAFFNNTVYIRALQSVRPQQLVRMIARKLGYTDSKYTRYPDIFDWVIDYAQSKQLIILVDESDYFAENHLNGLRDLSDQAGATIVFFGTNTFLNTIQKVRNAEYLQQFTSRLATKKVQTKPLSIQELAVFVLTPAFGDVSKKGAAIEAFMKNCQGIWRVADDLVDACKDFIDLYPENYKGGFSQKLVEAAAKDLGV